jgi:predicted RNA-binding Zn-ribbon protein involved in translation (DUF1610 family)
MNVPTETEMEVWNAGVKAQSLGIAGFCGYCGEACKPFHPKLPQELRDTACEYNGRHPDCGNHNMVYKETTSEVFGAYQIYECTKCGWQESC